VFVGSIVYFWQKSVNEKATGNLEQKIASLEKQVSTIKKTVVPSQITLNPLPSPTSTLPSDLEETASWETYANTAMGISFRYPNKTIEVLECESGNIFIVPLDRNFDPCQSSGGRFYITAKEPGFNLPDWYYRDYSITTESISFSSKNATKYSGIRVSSEQAPIPQGFYMITVPIGTKTILVNVEHYPASKTLDDNLINQILSSFRFLN